MTRACQAWRTLRGMPNIALRPKTDLSSFRKIAIGTWRTAKDPTVYGSLSLEMDTTLACIEAFRARTGKRLTLTHLMAKAVALALAEMPDANAILRYGRIYLREDVDIFFQVVMKDPETGQIDPSGLTIRRADQKSMPDIVDEFRRVAEKVRTGKDKNKESTRQTFKLLPGFVTGWLLDTISFLLYTLNLDMSWAGLPGAPSAPPWSPTSDRWGSKRPTCRWCPTPRCRCCWRWGR